MGLRYFIKKLIFFGLPFAFTWLGIEFYLLNKPLQNTYTAKAHYLKLKKDSIQTLLLGSSHILNAINPNYLATNSFNLANASQTLYYDSALVVQYLHQLPKLKTVIIGISYFSLFYELDDITESWRQQFYYQAFGLKPSNFHLFELTNYSKIRLYGFGKTYNLLKQNGVSEDCKNLLPNGFLFKSINEPINDSTGKRRVDVHNKQRFIYQYQKIKNRVQHLVQLLKNKHINVVFVTTPCHSSYYTFCNQEVVEKQENLIKELCLQFGCTYFNFFKDKRFVLEDFANADHLNLIGSEKFSKILNDSLSNKIEY